MSRRAISALVLALVAVSCTKPAVQIQIPFEPQVGGRPIACANPQFGISLTDLRLYVHSIYLENRHGDAVPVALDEDRWQNRDVALLDFEDGSGECANGTLETNLMVRGSVPAGDYRGLVFEVGVPFERNHADPLKAAAPLGDAAMHWHWRAGYKFLRAGLKTEDDGFWIHVGSTGCEGTVHDISSCRSPNRVIVRLADFNPEQDAVVIDLYALLSNTNLDDGTPTDCSSGPPETSCSGPFRALGIDHDTGRVVDQQRVFAQKDVR